MFTGIHHVTLITHDLDATIRFYRDLLECPLAITSGDTGFKHYFFEVSPSVSLSFFAYPATRTKEADEPARAPRGLDHLALGVASKADLLAMRDRLVAAGFAVRGPVDHASHWGIYFQDPNGIELELSCDIYRQVERATFDRAPSETALEGTEPQRGVWPDVLQPTAMEDFVATPGAGAEYVETMLERGILAPL